MNQGRYACCCVLMMLDFQILVYIRCDWPVEQWKIKRNAFLWQQRSYLWIKSTYVGTTFSLATFEIAFTCLVNTPQISNLNFENVVFKEVFFFVVISIDCYPLKNLSRKICQISETVKCFSCILKWNCRSLFVAGTTFSVSVKTTMPNFCLQAN